MKKLKHLASLLLATAALTMAACTPEKEEPADAQFLVNTSWALEESYTGEMEPGDTVSMYKRETIHFTTINEGEIIIKIETTFGNGEVSYPFTYTYGNKNGVLTINQDGETTRVHFDYNEEEDALIAPRPFGDVYHRVTE